MKDDEELLEALGLSAAMPSKPSAHVAETSLLPGSGDDPSANDDNHEVGLYSPYLANSSDAVDWRPTVSLLCRYLCRG
jgi:hypothetical protein